MKRCNRVLVLFIAAVLLSISLPTAVYANAAEPPSLTVIVSNPPDDLSLSLQLSGMSQSEAVVLRKERKAWETYYRFFNHVSPSGNDSLDGATLVVRSGDQSFECALPAGTFDRYNNLLSLDLKTESLTRGQSPLRVPILVAMRVALTLLIESVVFFLFGYRKRRSWLAFLAVNIVTQSGLNAMLTGPGIGSYWMIGYIIGEIVVIAVEVAALTCIVKEFRKRRTALCIVAANVASLILGGLLITYLPV
jgi:hypothetical protein